MFTRRQDARQLYTISIGGCGEAGVLAGLRSADMTVVSQASRQPSKFAKDLIVLPASVIGMLFGTMLAGIQDVRDDKVNSVYGETELGFLSMRSRPTLTSLPRLWLWQGYIRRYGARRKPEPLDESELERKKKSTRSSSLLSRLSYARPCAFCDGDFAVKTAQPQDHFDHKRTPAEGKSTTASICYHVCPHRCANSTAEVDLRRPVMGKRIGLPPLGRSLTYSDRQLPQIGSLCLTCIIYIAFGRTAPTRPHELISSATMNALIQKWSPNTIWSFSMVHRYCR